MLAPVMAWILIAMLALCAPAFGTASAGAAIVGDARGSLSAGAPPHSVLEPARETAPAEPPARRAVESLRDAGPWAPLAFVIAFVVLCLACVPGAFLTIAAGAVFGLGRGFLYAWLGAQLGASAAFLIGRYLARGWVERRLARHPMLAAVEEAMSMEGWKVVGLLRLAPGSPFFLLNYLFSVTHVRYRDYALATAVASAPGTLMLVYIGSLGHMALDDRARSAWEWLLHGAGLVAVAAASALVARRARHLVRMRLDPGFRPNANARPEGADG